MNENQESLKIAMIGQKNLDRSGGIEVVVTELSTRMAKLGYKVTCFCRRAHHVSGRKFDTKIVNDYQGVVVKKVPTIDRKGLAAITSSFFAMIYCIFGNYDIIHFHAEGPCVMLWLPKIVWKNCIATIYEIPDIIFAS